MDTQDRSEANSEPVKLSGIGVVSLYPKISVTHGGQAVRLLSILEGIRTGRWRNPIEELRALSSEREQSEAKKKLPYFTVSGTFSTREERGLVEHSGFACLDIDKKQNTAIDFDTLRLQLEAESYTYALFQSSRGEQGGLAVIVKIPTEDHKGSYLALSEYYEEKYKITLDSTSNVAWPRFVSYDPRLYLNPESDIFEEVQEEEVYQPVSQKYTASPTRPQTYGQAALQTAVRKIMEASPGDKHHVRKRMSYLCGGYIATGLLTEHEAQQALEQAIMQSSPQSAWRDAFKTIASGLKKGQEKPLLPEPLERMVYESKRHGEQRDYITQKIAVSNGGNAKVIQQVVEQIYTERELTILTFWDVLEDEKKGTCTLKLSYSRFISFLSNEGFRKYKAGQTCLVVRVLNNVVTEVSNSDIKDFASDYLNKLPFKFDNIFRSDLVEQVQKNQKHLFEKGQMEFLPELPDTFVRDEKDRALFFYQNGFAQVTGEEVQLKPYAELHGLIWERQILPRTFLPENEEAVIQTDFSQFLYNISGSDDKRLFSLMTAIGYLLHGYKSPSNPRVIILVDEAISDNPSGGTGKSLVFHAVSKMIQVEMLDGKTLDFRDKFVFQGVTEATRLVVFEDWDGKRLPFDKLFNMTTTEMKINKLYQGQISIPYERSPKFGITSNDMISGEGASHARRKFELEVAPYYSQRFKPVDEFKSEFFTEWDLATWNLFDNLMLYCCQCFLKSGLREGVQINLQRRKLLQETQINRKNTGFAAFMDEKLKDSQGGWLQQEAVFPKNELWLEFREGEGITEKELSLTRFNEWLKKYAFYEGLLVDTSKEKRDLLGKKSRVVVFSVQG